MLCTNKKDYWRIAIGRLSTIARIIRQINGFFKINLNLWQETKNSPRISKMIQNGILTGIRIAEIGFANHQSFRCT